MLPTVRYNGLPKRNSMLMFEVRMLLKPGYKGVYVSRSFATKHKLLPQKVGQSGAPPGREG